MTGLSTNQLQDQSEDPDIHPDLQHLVANGACCRIWYCTDCVYLLIIWYRNRYGVILSRWTVISVRECRWFFLNKGGSRRSESCGTTSSQRYSYPQTREPEVSHPGPPRSGLGIALHTRYLASSEA